MKFLALLMLLALIGVGNLYIIKRLGQSVRYLLPKLPRRVDTVVFFLFLFLLTVGFYRNTLPLPTPLKQGLGTINAYFMGIYIYLLLFFLLGDLVLLCLRFCKLVKHPLPQGTRALAGAIAVVVALVTCCYGFLHVNQIQTVSYHIPFTKVTMEGEMKLALVSDLHMGAQGSLGRLEKVVDAINQQQPDLICIAGDLFDSDYNAMKNPKEFQRVLQKLSAPHGVYACFGNHDAGQTYPQMVSFLKSCNITLLQDQWVTVDNRIVLVGRLDGSPIGGYQGTTRKELGEVLQNAPTLPIVVLDHNPQNADEYAPNDAHLILSGHTHKGQIFPANLFTNLIYTSDYGYYQKDENHPHRIVTSGGGIWGMPMRVGTNSEVVMVRLHS